MLTGKQLSEIREWLEKSQNPVFFFDNDVDGLTSFLILQRFIERGKGVAIRSFPDLNKSYARKISELGPDVIFIVDKPLVDPEFFEEVRMKNIPVIWIDHHPLQKIDFENVHYYNPLQGEKPSNEPVSYWCYKATGKDLWLAFSGCISDWFYPDFAEEFRKKYYDLIGDYKKADEILFETKIGRLINILNFALKDSTSNVVKMTKSLEKAKDPHEIFSDEKYRHITLRYEHINKKFEDVFEKAQKAAEKAKKLVFFKYSGEIKFSSELSNRLMYKYPGKIIAVAMISGEKVNISFRGKKVRDYIEKALEKIGGRGGGHETAAAATIQKEDLDKFISEIEKQL
jgi:single-stranded DNA-specific DHH superfamily exonuclease